MATPITALDSANISVVDNQYIVSITGSFLNQEDLDYLLSSKYSFTGSLITPNSVGGVVGFEYPILAKPSGSTASVNYPDTTKTDFDFFLNGVRMENSQVINISTNPITLVTSTASFDLGFTLRDYDVITAKGKFKV